MQQGRAAGAGLGGRGTAGMTDEQILDLDLAQFAAAAPEIAPEAAGEPDLWEMTSLSGERAPHRGLSAPESSSTASQQNGATTSSGAESSTYRRLSAHGQPSDASAHSTRYRIEHAECAGRAGVAETARGAASGCGRSEAMARSGQRRGGAGRRLLLSGDPVRARRSGGSAL